MRRLALFFAATALVGCGESLPDPAAVEVLDSAGVRIVSMIDHDPPAWVVDSNPFVDIGTAEGEDGHDLALPWASRRLADGRIAISNARTSQLRFYRPDGTFIESLGGSGGGPGEYETIGAIHLGVNDSIIVSDTWQTRLNVYDPRGVFTRTVPVEPLEGRPPRLRGLVHDTMAVYRVTYFGRSGGVSRAVRDTSFLFARPLNGGATVTIGRFLANEKFNQVLPNGSVAAWNLPFSRGFFATCTLELLWIAVSDRYELMGYDVEHGSLQRVTRVNRRPVAVDAAHRDGFFAHQLAGAESANEEQTYRDVHRIIEFPRTMPVLSDLVSDSEGNLWVKDYDVPWSDDPTTWRVFNSEGTMVAMVRLPHGLDVHDIGEDYVLGQWNDELGVEHIRGYRLTKQP
jgi:hypothetical protein